MGRNEKLEAERGVGFDIVILWNEHGDLTRLRDIYKFIRFSR